MMKTIFHLIITCLICITLTSSSQKYSERKNRVILQATDNKITSQLLTQSAKVISDRLKTYGITTNVNIIADKGQIEVQLPDNIIGTEIEGLLVSKGELAFYETLTLKEIGDLLKKNNQPDLPEIDPGTTPSDARLGCSAFENPELTDKFQNYLKSINLLSDYKLLWGLKNSKSLTCLYALRINNIGTSDLKRPDVETIKSSPDKNAQSFTIEIKFKSGSVRIWAEATRNSIGKPIAIVIDNKVFYTPVVRVVIENGLCEITGNFSQKDVDYFLAIVNTDQLSLNLKLK